MDKLQKYQELFAEAIQNNLVDSAPTELYEPMNYILNLGGKRLRPIITFLSCDLFGGDLQAVIKPSLAIEFFHNFTLMHDDIMDSGTLRRGKPCVHIAYDVNTAILSGDALLIRSYQYFEDLPPEAFKKVVSLFSDTALTLCEGQQYDLNFERQKDVSFEEYMNMIFYKTGALTAAAFKIGAIIANAPEKDADLIYQFGKHLGIAFQLKDDLLDVYGRQESFGKKHAGDIHENKKTILYIKAMEKGSEEDKKELTFWYNMRTDNIDKVYGVEKIFNKLRINKEVEKLIEEHTQLAKSYLKQIDADEKEIQFLVDFSDYLISRNN